LSDEQHAEVLARIENEQFRIFYLACYNTGARPGELAIIRKHHFNGSEFVLSPKEWKNGKKQNRERHIGLTPELITFVKERIATMNDDEDGYIFVNLWRTAWSNSTWTDNWEKVRPSADYVFYCVRHTYITRALLAGANVADVANQCGTSIAMIDKVYSKLRFHPESRGRVIAALNGKPKKDEAAKAKELLATLSAEMVDALKLVMGC
jgi:integrase